MRRWRAPTRTTPYDCPRPPGGLSWMRRTGAATTPPRGLSWMQRTGAATTPPRGLSWMQRTGAATTPPRGAVAAPRRGLSWFQGALASLAAVLLLLTAMPAAHAAEAPAPAAAGEYVVQAADLDAARSAVEAAGGEVLAELATVGVITADLPAGAAADLAGDPAVGSMSPNVPLQLLGWDGKESRNDKTGELQKVRGTVTRATEMWEAGYNGSGVDVALIDSGVVPVDGLTVAGKILHGPDLSFESQADHLRHLDTFGHGTHMAGIIAGREDAVSVITQPKATRQFIGMAPGARIVSLKVADANGATDVSQVIAAIDWVVQHRNTDGLNIRVLNLSYGTDSTQSYQLDPLSYATEVAWQHGIVVVAAAGNDGNGHALRNPAHDPFVIAVGAVNSAGSSGTGDDTIPSFSNCGTAARHVDVVAPGKSIVSVGAPGSAAWQENPDAIVDDRFMKGSGTSQAAAVVSGAAALLLDQRPDLTPDQVKALLTDTAETIPGAWTRCQGAGLIDLAEARSAPTPLFATQTHVPSNGLGSLDAARGSMRVVDGGVALEGEQDIFGKLWDGASWSAAAYLGASWSGGSWNGSIWTGASWNGASWSGASWNGASWSGASWNGASWNGQSWNGASWNGGSWSGRSWSGGSWSAGVWLSKR